MKKLPPILTGNRRIIFVRLIINGMTQAAMIAGSMLLVRHAFDVLLNPAFDDPEVNLFDMTEVGTIGFFAVGLLTCTLFAAMLRLQEQVDAERLGQDYVHRVRMSLFTQMNKLSPRSLNRRSSGGVMLRFVSDLAALRRWVSLGLARIVVAVIITALSLGFMGYLDPSLAAGSFIILCLGLLGNLSLGSRLHRAVSESRRLQGRLAGNINEKVQAINVIQAFNQNHREKKKFLQQSRQLRDAMIVRARAVGAMRITSEGSSAASMGLVLSLGALEVFKGTTTAGNVVAAMAVVGFLAGSFRSLGRVHEYRQGARVSEQKILEFLSSRTIRGRSSSLPPLVVTEGRICFSGISLQGCLSDISVTAPSRARVALIGPNGAGKSTLLQIAARMIDPSAGSVLIDDQDLVQCNLASVRKAIGIVSPDFPLLRGTLRYNLRYRHPQATAEELARVKGFCRIDELIDTLPNGERYRLEEGGRNLSLGQRHRLALARALLGDPSILLIDEIDANLDQQAAVVLDQILESFPGTILLVTRDDQRLSKTDFLWHMADGKLISVESTRAENDGTADPKADSAAPDQKQPPGKDHHE